MCSLEANLYIILIWALLSPTILITVQAKGFMVHLNTLWRQPFCVENQYSQHEGRYVNRPLQNSLKKIASYFSS